MQYEYIYQDVSELKKCYSTNRKIIRFELSREEVAHMIVVCWDVALSLDNSIRSQSKQKYAFD